MDLANRPVNRLSQTVRDALARQDQAFLPKGLVFNDPRSSEAHLRRTTTLLADRQVASPCGRAVAHVTELFEKSITPQQKSMLACRTGCAFCCYQPVAVTAPEAFYLAAVLQLRPETVAQMQGVAQQSADRDPDGKTVSWFRCPLLDEGDNCSAYRARPIACHAFVSLNVEDCKASLERPGESIVMEPRGYAGVKDHCRIILLAAMKIHGLPLVFYEMNAAVAAVSKIPNAEKRWLRGENVFGDLRTITPLKPDAARTVDFLAQNIAPTL